MVPGHALAPLFLRGQKCLLAPPIVGDRIHEYAKAVHVSCFLAPAAIRVYLNKADLVEQAKLVFGFADDPSTRVAHPMYESNLLGQ